MNCFVDTSALFAVLDKKDENFIKAREQWKKLIESDIILVCSNYILLETIFLVQNRLGMEALGAFQEDMVSILKIEWVTEEIHHAGISTVLSAGKKKVSLVDFVSFDVMRRLGIKTAFTFDKHFKEQGFTCVP